MLDISFTDEVSKLDKSIDSNKTHPSNKWLIFVTDDVLKYSKLIFFIELHPENIEEISFNFDASK